MKKIVCLILAAVMIFALAACGSTGSGKLLKKGVLIVATSPDFAPMEFTDTSKTGQDQYVGFDITLAKYIASELGLELEIKPMSFDACLAAVQSGKVDMSLSGFSWKEDRAENFELTDYYQASDEQETEQVVIVTSDKAGQLTTAADFEGLTIAVQAASLQLELAEKQLPGAEIKQFTDIGTEVEALRNGNVDGVAVAKGNGDAIIANNDNIAFSGFEFEVDAKYKDNVGLIKKGNTELLADVNAVLAKAKAADLYSGWYAEAKALAGISTAAQAAYDDEGNFIENID